MRSFYLCVWIFLMFSNGAFAQKNLLKGRIVDEKQLPVQGASVIL